MRASHKIVGLLVRATVVVALLALGTFSSEKVYGQTTDPIFGFNGDCCGATYGQVASTMRSENPNSVLRLQLNWAVLQNGCSLSGQTFYECLGTPNTPDFSALDAEVTAFKGAGIKILLMVLNAPGWAWNLSDCDGQYSGCGSNPGAVSVPPQDDNQHYTYMASFIQQAITNLNQTYPNGVVGFEVWNEENTHGFWPTNTGPDPARYARLLCAAFNGVRNAGSSIPVLFGGLLPVATNPNPNRLIAISDFLTPAYATNAGNCMNGIGLHVYAGANAPDSQASSYSTMLNSLSALHTALVANNDANRPIWITELGYCTGRNTITCSADGSVGQTVTLQQQASDLECAYQMLVGTPNIQAVIVHDLDDAQNANSPLQDPQFGIFNYPGSSKPAATTLAQLFAKYGTQVPAISNCSQEG